MNRRENIKSLILAGLSAPLITNKSFSRDTVSYLKAPKELVDTDESNWHNLPDMDWAGPKYWGNRLQDWSVKNGRLLCAVKGESRTLHHLNWQLGNSRNSFRIKVNINLAKQLEISDKNKIGFVLGSKSWNHEYRASAIHGNGLRVGFSTSGKFFVGNEMFPQYFEKLQRTDELILEVSAEPMGKDYNLTLSASDGFGNLIGSISKYQVHPENLLGNVALFCHFEELDERGSDNPVCNFNHWKLHGKKFLKNENQEFGPICFTQYTRQKNKVKLTVQLTPLPLSTRVEFEIKKGEEWIKIDESEVKYPSYTSHFRFDNWEYIESIPFRVSCVLNHLNNQSEVYYWNGSIAKEPFEKKSIKAFVASCNHDMGFPDQDIVEYGAMHDPDIILFLGDQFYEINGHFGFQTEPLEKAYLDYLRKWYMFGWSYRELFRNLPIVNLPDDHDVFQGNLFGANGVEFPKSSLDQGLKRDHGGFMMPAEWVNLAMITQTSHMPDPYDSTPIERGIHVFYSNWDYAGISFGIIEDRKFKSGPSSILPKEAEVRDAFIENPEFPIKEKNYPNADLLGERQLEFLKHWIEKWSNSTEFKILLSASPFHALQTLPDKKSNGMQQRLEIPEKGEYIFGDVPVADMDSGGWPQFERNEALRIIRKSYTLHLAGDQHLPSVTQYGIDNYRDSGYAFAVPAIANSWPRRWWPPVSKPLDGQPGYTGNHEDAFGNRMYVRAVANPTVTGLEPEKLYDRSPGYGIVTFDKATRDVLMECWPRYINPIKNPSGQFDGWPVVVNQLENNYPATPYFLPMLKILGMSGALIKVFNKEGIECILRIKGSDFQPVVSNSNEYVVQIIDKNDKVLKQLDGLKGMQHSNNEIIEISLG